MLSFKKRIRQTATANQQVKTINFMKKILVGLSLLSAHCCFAQDSIFYQNAEWSPNGKEICTEVIRSSGPGFSFEGYIINVKEKAIDRKIFGASFPAWSPDGKFVAYSKRNTSPHGADIWLMNVVTGDTTQLMNDTSRNSGLSFSPDGKKICFSSDRDGGRNLYIMNADGSDIQRITFDTAGYYNPVWSPKGDKIVYYREVGDRRDKVWLLDIADKKERKVTDDTLHNTFPGWLPDGKTISYTSSDLFSKNRTPSQIAFIDADSHNKRVIPNVTAFVSRVSPDGKKVAVIKGGWPASNIYIINIDGSDPVCITCNLIK
jgi:Tol biopolymer transport system component